MLLCSQDEYFIGWDAQHIPTPRKKETFQTVGGEGRYLFPRVKLDTAVRRSPQTKLEHNITLNDGALRVIEIMDSLLSHGMIILVGVYGVQVDKCIIGFC